MSDIKTIVYLGPDQEFAGQLEAFAGTYFSRDYEVNSEAYSPGSILRMACDYEPNILILEVHGNLESIAEELRIIKRMGSLRPTMTALICKDREEVELATPLLLGEVTFFFIKGGEVSYFLRDCLYMGLDQKVFLPAFAQASNLFLKLEVGLLCCVTATSTQSLLLETDMNLDTVDSVLLSLRYLLDSPGSFDRLRDLGPSCTWPMLESYELKYPIAGPWDEPRNDNLQQETVDTWLEAKEDEFDLRQQTLRVYSKNLKVLEDLGLLSRLPYFVDFYDEVEVSPKLEDPVRRPAVMFYALEDNSNEVEALNSLSCIIQEVKRQSDYRPVIVVFNSPSSSEALKKILIYDHLMSVPNPLTTEYFRLFIDKLLERGPVVTHDYRFLRPLDPCRAATLPTEVMVTSLTEHEITFYSSLEIPMFSCIQFTLPVPFFVTVVPPSTELHKRSDEHHYMGIIHGIDEDGLEDLRRIVNQMIYQPVKELDRESVNRMLKQEKIVGTAIQNTEHRENSAISPMEPDTSAEIPGKVANSRGRFKVSRKHIIGRSKL